MVWTRQIQNRIRDHNGLFEVLIDKPAAERIITFFNDHPISEPLPELILRGPELPSALTKNQGVVLFTLASLTLVLFLFPLFLFCLNHGNRTLQAMTVINR